MGQVPPDGFEPVPWTHIRWHMDTIHPAVVRLWGWLASKTIRKGHWSAYARDTGRDGHEIELHIENAAKALDMDEANVRRAWREGERGVAWGLQIAATGVDCSRPGHGSGMLSSKVVVKHVDEGGCYTEHAPFQGGLVLSE